MFVPLSARPTGLTNQTFFHPAFIYESILDFLLFVILFNTPNKRGGWLSIYLFGYSLIRFIVEFFRVDSDMIGMLSIAQWISLVLMVGVVIFWIIKRKIKL